MTWTDVFAPAKINLTLHITGQRDDGYHLLDSLVVFAPVGDALRVAPAEDLSLRVEGPEAAGIPANGDNLALRATAMVGEGQGAEIVLEKVLPVASGIGGGSADAAAAARAVLAELGPLDETTMTRAEGALLALGADVPMCLASRPVRVRGIGEGLEPVTLPPLPAVLVNPRVPVSTPQIFRSLTSRDNPPMPERLPEFAGAEGLIDWLRDMRNDMEPAARALEPVIGTVLSELEALPGCRLARMSGSGATCFGLFASMAEAGAAAEALRAARPDWWIAEGLLGDQQARAMPRRG
ncbi:4-(cytidine 5'-diphospho)-2-C-methyl-D-erythritol kinase [Salipiger sp. PrR002]|uniref:4-(cytidine 5'-diphospho)-2-C-methyl-D-erythritol kinase n=1 Tax=Salipiger sp. PrR002 TaxID=2706489 RepID=UPI0013BE5D71|nr:4-(cytidine 5'-diphospho)-2-C-methyl-D-erythritol kinase [Salipiger sp. PrR002]NDV98492.1 4-(cytidine 5'-diphospho)-2-C-methyl-D-erythritol kinase [Salipiger sp. PrR002]NDW57327.1 4-(cytidine 5'-diphospho)-2-C-methyl-D-erythritol kinase [Salipiger sp. PrR004]